MGLLHLLLLNPVQAYLLCNIVTRNGVWATTAQSLQWLEQSRNSCSIPVRGNRFFCRLIKLLTFRRIVLPSERKYLFTSRHGIMTQMTWIFNTIDVRTPNPTTDFLFSPSSRPAVCPSQPPIQREPGGSVPKLKRSERESDHSLSSHAKVNNVRSYTSTPAVCLQGIHEETIFTDKPCRSLQVKAVIKQPRYLDICNTLSSNFAGTFFSFICSVCVQPVLRLSVFHGIFTDFLFFNLVNVLLSI